ncbi:MFS general substrate transporter [Vararia minispora EC-137]|uniref:MFS general substrate transporter n=1 Tax=Vararia minispora EC-137 TaxID=1314806 RepID=A0ACB8QYZ9_9AGAM|nr:MFS general substrate transporter [Vararia minispora EC-137]
MLPLRPDETQNKLRNRVLWKLDIHVLPPLALMWLANFIDRTNIGNARISGLEHDTHLVGNQFNVALAVFYASYIIVELPSNWVLKKARPNRWLPFLLVAWGIVTTLSGLVQSFSGLIAVRVMLGLCEGGLLPGMMLYLSTLYRRHELQLRRMHVLICNLTASLSGAFGGLLATAIIKMDGLAGLAGWRWIFILEGIATCLIGLLAAAVLPAGLDSARFFTDDERTFAIERFRAGNQITSSAPSSSDAPKLADVEEKGKEDLRVEMSDTKDEAKWVVNQEDEEFEWREIVRGFLEIQVWLTAMSYLGLIVSLYSFSLFLPTIVAGLGFSGGAAQLHTGMNFFLPPYVPAVFLTVVVAFVADRYRIRGPLIMLFLPLTIAGSCSRILGVLTPHMLVFRLLARTNEVRYGAVFLIASGLYPSAPCILSILPNNTSGHYKKATCVALQLALANLGGFVATFVYTPDQAPQYVRGHTIVLGFVCMAWVLITANVAYCIWENKARKDGKRQRNLEVYRILRDSGKTRAPIGDRHPEFLFTL